MSLVVPCRSLMLCDCDAGAGGGFLSVFPGVGPMAALRKSRLQDSTEFEKRAWMERARVDAVLDSCRLSLKSVQSGIRCYVAFTGIAHM